MIFWSIIAMHWTRTFQFEFSIDFEANRFHIGQWGKEINETLVDITAHSTESFILMIGLLYRQMLNLPHFINNATDLREWNNLISNYSLTMDSEEKNRLFSMYKSH